MGSMVEGKTGLDYARDTFAFLYAIGTIKIIIGMFTGFKMAVPYLFLCIFFWFFFVQANEFIKNRHIASSKKTVALFVMSHLGVIVLANLIWWMIYLIVID